MEDTGKLRVGVLFGGLSCENEVSLATGRYVYSLLDPQKFFGIPLYLDRQGLLWQLPDKLVIQNTTADIEMRLLAEAVRVRIEELPEKVDVVFNTLLGKYGEDGCTQGILELIGVPYTGSGILASALGMDKKMHKELLSSQGYSVARDLLVTAADCADPQKISNLKSQISNSLGYPCVVKPTREGSSMGVSVVRNESQMAVALEYAFKYDREVLIEEYLRGLEYTCVVWGNTDPQAMLPTEIVFEGDFFTYEGKYMPGRTQTITPARLSEEVIKEIQKISVGVYKLIGCVGYGRIDGFVVPKSPDPGSGCDNGAIRKPDLQNLPLDEVSIYVTEPHTGTIMVPSSFVFQQASKFRIELDDRFTGQKISTPLTPRMLVTKIVEMALEAHKTKKGLL